MVARWAHNPKVVRSNRASATFKEEILQNVSSFLFDLCLIFFFLKGEIRSFSILDRKNL